MSDPRELLDSFAKRTSLPKLPTKANMDTLGIYKPTASEMDLLLMYYKESMAKEREEIIKTNKQFKLSNHITSK